MSGLKESCKPELKRGPCYSPLRVRLCGHDVCTSSTFAAAAQQLNVLFTATRSHRAMALGRRHYRCHVDCSSVMVSAKDEERLQSEVSCHRHDREKNQLMQGHCSTDRFITDLIKLSFGSCAVPLLFTTFTAISYAATYSTLTYWNVRVLIHDTCVITTDAALRLQMFNASAGAQIALST